MNVSKTKGGLYNPELREMVRKGQYSPSSELSENRFGDASIMRVAKKRYLSHFETLVYYFGEEWFDLKEDLSVYKKLNQSTKVKMLNQPSRCDKCNREWAVDCDEEYFLESFKGIPMDKKTCGECK